MRIHLIIGPTAQTTDRLRAALKAGKAPLEAAGFVFPNWNHIRLYMASADAPAVGLLRHKRGFATAEAQDKLRGELREQLGKLTKDASEALVLCNSHLASMLHTPTEIKRLHALLSEFSDDIRLTAHIAEQSQVLAPLYTGKVAEGRAHSLDAELALAASKDWWNGALALREPPQPQFGLFNDVQHPAPWLDYEAMLGAWEDVFGKDSLELRPALPPAHTGPKVSAELQEIIGSDVAIEPIRDAKDSPQPSADTVSRARQFNALLIKYMQTRKEAVSRDLWKKLLNEMAVAGDPIDPATLSAVSKHFSAPNKRLIKRFPALADALKPVRKRGDWAETSGGMGFRASQYLTAFGHRIRKNSEPVAELMAAQETDFDNLIAEGHLPDDERADMIAKIKLKHEDVISGIIKPHNTLGRVNEEEMAAAYTEAAPRKLKGKSTGKNTGKNTGRVIVGCMKNEAPYIAEWIAYHRAIGVDNFLIYTNGCEDGTSEILDRMQELGYVEHRNNDNWKGNSPQQYALNASLKEDVIKHAEWIAHIDVDEFINVRTGNGTLDDLFDALPADATNIAMTWRLFGHNGVTKLSDELVIEQFDTCAPKYCPKPHTVWGFKSMFRNMNAYRKISCHRPNQVIDEKRDDVKWVNGSGEDVTKAYIKGGWRSSRKTIGYDLVQLNHYALRSAESFLIKRQRGRALHVDRSIGLNYWIRMDWSDFRDITIKRGVPRTRAELARMMEDKKLAKLHGDGMKWHKDKVKSLHQLPEFQELYAQALGLKLSETERVAYALALDMES